ncbi:hypothetical protein RJT34_24061 [Clitoria ternatea]|uniref:Uncharacterized protein n=1 Tax=Clitoria ternatea TaxID=43366 RepID=A0AAN9FNY3_CLITE
MPSPVQPNHSPSAEAESHKQLDREIRDMISTITHHATNLHKSSSGPTHHLENNEEDHGLSMITLVGNNNGATMKSDLDEKSSNTTTHGNDEEEPEGLSTYVNSNFQAINNSLMLGGSYHANDPGVKLDISDFFTTEHHHNKAEMHGKKGKKKEKEASKHKYQYLSDSH